MDEMNNAVDTAIENETADAFDSAWDDDLNAAEESTDDFDFEDSEEQAEAEAAADEPEAEAEPSAEQTETVEEQPAEDEKPEAEDNTKPEAYVLKVDGETISIERDSEDIIPLLQKGKAFDRVKGQLEEAKTKAAELSEHEAFLAELAEADNSSVSELIDRTRARMLMKKEAAEGREISETDALFRVQRQRGEASKAKAKEAEAQSEAEEKKAEAKPDEAAIRKTVLLKFVEKYPAVDAKDIPAAVYEEGFAKGDLVAAWESHKLRSENEALKKELETLKQNEKNKVRSTGSRQSYGSTGTKDAFDEAWGSD